MALCFIEETIYIIFIELLFKYFRENTWMCAGDGTEGENQAGSPLIRHPTTMQGLIPKTKEITIWAETKSLILNWLSPRCSCNMCVYTHTHVYTKNKLILRRSEVIYGSLFLTLGDKCLKVLMIDVIENLTLYKK